MDAAIQAELSRLAESGPQFPQIYPRTVPGRVMDLDGDYLAYYDGTAESASKARWNALARIDKYRLQSGSESVLMHLSDVRCNKGWRFLIGTVKPYQGQRKGARKPPQWAHLRECFQDYKGGLFTPKSWIDREADDGIARASLRENRVICTRDKDMRMLPGLHINWTTSQLIEVPRGCWDLIGDDGLQYGLKWFYLQLLQGDGADNIPGIPRLFGAKCADKTAAKYLAPATCREEAFELIKRAYKGHYPDTWADALAEQAGLLWLRTDAKASIHNILEPFPEDAELADAVTRLDERVKQRVIELQLN